MLIDLHKLGKIFFFYNYPRLREKLLSQQSLLFEIIHSIEEFGVKKILRVLNNLQKRQISLSIKKEIKLILLSHLSSKKNDEESEERDGKESEELDDESEEEFEEDEEVSLNEEMWLEEEEIKFWKYNQLSQLFCEIIEKIKNDKSSSTALKESNIYVRVYKFDSEDFSILLEKICENDQKKNAFVRKMILNFGLLQPIKKKIFNYEGEIKDQEYLIPLLFPSSSIEKRKENDLMHSYSNNSNQKLYSSILSFYFPFRPPVINFFYFYFFYSNFDFKIELENLFHGDQKSLY